MKFLLTCVTTLFLINTYCYCFTDVFDAIKEGKSDEVYEVLLHQKKIDRLTTSELTPDLAIDIIKTNLQSKYKDLTSEEVDLLFYDNYYFPAKPEKDDYDSDEDYEKKVNTWQSVLHCDFLCSKMLLDSNWIVSTTLDSSIIGNNHAFNSITIF